MKLVVGLIVFIAGVGLGYSATYLPSQYVNPYLPPMLQAEGMAVKGLVVEKQREADRLLLTVSTPSGALLAIFPSHITEIDLLVEIGDTVTLGLRAYEPFVEDPVIQAVMKPDYQSVSEMDEMASPAADATSEISDRPASHEQP